jgi:hypothetical protein
MGVWVDWGDSLVIGFMGLIVADINQNMNRIVAAIRINEYEQCGVAQIYQIYQIYQIHQQGVLT